MIAQRLHRLKRAVWTWRQPLTAVPSAPNVPISDLFVWRSTDDWQTFFELIDIPSLFEGVPGARYVTLVFLDVNGQRFLEKRVELQSNCRQTLNISSMVGKDFGEAGTFAVFHSLTPVSVSNLGSNLAERGYVSYRFKDAPLRSYVHGNLDAVSLDVNGELQLLGGRGFLRRDYSLQHELQPGVSYELALVNPTSATRRCICKLVSVGSGKIRGRQSVKLAPGGAQFIPVQIDKSDPVRVVIQSYLIMARPLVFRFQNLKLDVFHG